MSGKNWTRRQVLKGAGVALSLPVLETFGPQTHKALAADAASKTRYISMYFANGTADLWTPTGLGANWVPSPILEPITKNKQYCTVLGNIGNYSPWAGHIEPSHGHNCASAYTGVRANGPGLANNGISIDQAIANQLITNNGGKQPTTVHSLQLGLTTLESSPDGIPGPHSRSISWKAADQPLGKVVSPQRAFEIMVGGGVTATPGMTGVDPAAEKRRALNKSALDYVLASSDTLKKRLSTSDRSKLDFFMTSVRSLEQRVNAPTMPVTLSGCTPLAKPTQAYGVGAVPAGYNRGAHATLMIDLTVMAIQCDITRVITYMLDDARSDFVYNFLNERTFTATGSTEGTRPVGGYHNLQHAGSKNNGFATIGYWNVQQVNDLVTKLAMISDGAGGNVMNNTVVQFMSGMHGDNHDSQKLPICLIGSAGGVLKAGQYINFPTVQNLQDVHLTLLTKVFGSKATSWGAPMGAYTSGIIPDLLA
jgi:hypothetical protein